MAMEGSGQPYNYSVRVSAPVSEVMQALLSIPRGGNYFDGYQAQQATPSSVHVTRNHVPIWAAVIAIAGFWVCGLGLLALLIRETEVLTATVIGGDPETRVDVSGIATPIVARAVGLAYDRFSPSQA
jgi:hypothetical protein